ncbi:MAG: amidohydrolase family protein [Gemmatimonadetes bacterium]|nr:amidohydrolase family protein [Gemmatimonadota bacterium]MYG21440.1 amidohydrolase family protein [Gemmatimonadota bacterium]MYJ40467.1 amidohydrolase family protein [Gemmatimonadota bacterium]
MRYRAGVLLAMLLCGACVRSGETADLIIVGGIVVDGSGDPPRTGTVVIAGNSIVTVGGAAADGGGARAPDTIDASGLVVAPGFIDVHNHTPPAIVLPGNNLNEGFIRQGVTTVFGGPDGAFAPANIRRFSELYAAQGIGTNVAFYVGHNGIRNEVLGEDQRRAPTAEELETMRALVREGMELGAFGFSTGLMYEPGMFSETAEVIALAMEAAEYDGVYDSHVRNPVHDFVGSDREVVEIAETAGLPGKIGHLKAVGLHNEGVIADIVGLVEDARERGVVIVSDQYPYDGAATASLTGIVVAPPDLQGLDAFRQMQRQGRTDEAMTQLKAALADPGSRARLKEASENGVDGGFAWLSATGYTSMRITSSSDYPELVGAYLSEIAEQRDQDPFDAVAELIIGSSRPVNLTLGAIKEHDVRRLMIQPWNMIASDGGFADGSDAPGGHPRSAGTFPRLLGHYARDEGVLSLAEAVRKITSLPADFHGIDDRGRLAAGMRADIAIFDPATIIDQSDWDHPQRFSEGVVHVLVNGVPVLRDGEMTGEAPGEVVRR